MYHLPCPMYPLGYHPPRAMYHVPPSMPTLPLGGLLGAMPGHVARGPTPLQLPPRQAVQQRAANSPKLTPRHPLPTNSVSQRLRQTPGPKASATSHRNLVTIASQRRPQRRSPTPSSATSESSPETSACGPVDTPRPTGACETPAAAAGPGSEGLKGQQVCVAVGWGRVTVGRRLAWH